MSPSGFDRRSKNGEGGGPGVGSEPGECCAVDGPPSVDSIRGFVGR